MAITAFLGAGAGRSNQPQYWDGRRTELQGPQSLPYVRFMLSLYFSYTRRMYVKDGRRTELQGPYI